VNWRDIAKKLRAYAPPELLSEFEVPDGASDSELVDAVFKKVPEFRQASGVDENDLKADIQKWGQLRADREQARLLGGAARDTRRAFQAGTEMGSFPLNEGLRAAGKIGPEENLSDVASEVAGGGAKGAAAGAITSVLTDPTSLIGAGAATRLGAAAKASPTAAKALSGVVLGALASQNYQLYKVGLEKGFTSPEFEAAAAAANAGLVASAALGNPRAVLEGGRGLVREGLVKTLDRTPMPVPERVTPPLEVVDRNPIAFLGEPSAPQVSNAARLKALKDAEIYAKARAGIGESRARAEAARAAAEFQDATNPLAALGAPTERRSMAGAMAPVDLVPTPDRMQALRNAEIYAKARAERRSMDLQRQKDLEEAFASVDPDSVVLRGEILGQLTPPKPKPPQKTLFSGGKNNITELTPAELEARDIAIKELERDVMDIDALTPDAPTVKRIGDTPRAYEHGLPEDRLPIVDNSIAALESDVDTLKQAPKTPTLYQRIKNLGKIHIDDFKDATGLESKDIPKKYRDMFRHSGERNFDRIIQTLGQESWYDVDGGHFTNATERFWDDVSKQISGDDVFGPGDSALAEARNRIEDIAGRVGVSRGKLIEALQKRDGNPIERRFNEVVAKNDPYDIEGQMMASENPDSPPEFGGEDGFDPTTFEDEGYGHMSLKKPRKPVPYSRNPEVNAAVDRIGGPQVARDLGLQWNSVTSGPKAEKLPGVTETQIRGLNAEMLADPTIRTFDETPAPVPGIPPEAVAIGREKGFSSPEFRAAIKAAAPPPPVAPVGAGEAAKPSRLPEYDGKEWSVERPMQEGTTFAGKAVDVVREQARTAKSLLKRHRLAKTADTIDQIAWHADDQIQKARTAEDKLRALGATEKDFAERARLVEAGEKPTDPRLKQIDEILTAELDRTHQVAIEKDPLGAAPWEPNYHPRTGVAQDAVKPVFSAQDYQNPLDIIASHRAASLSKTRKVNATDMDAEAFTKPITDPEKIYEILRTRARTAGALIGGAQKPRTPENYPSLWGAILDDQRRKLLGAKAAKAGKALTEGQSLQAEKKAKEVFDAIQLPDVFESVAKDTGDPWHKILKNEAAIKAANSVIRGRDAMDPTARTIAEGAKSVAAFTQLGMAAPLNLMGVAHAGPMAHDIVKGAGKGELAAQAAGSATMLKALGLTAKASAQDIAAAIKRLGGSKELSPSQLEFGRSGAGLNIARRAVQFLDRNARKGVADALEPLIPMMRPETLKYIDRGLEGGLSNPKNVEIIRKELSARTQGSGTSADRLLPTGNAFVDLYRELAMQYTGPSLRQAETAFPRIATPGAAALGLVGAAGVGEMVQDMRAVGYGTGINAGGEETFDQTNPGADGFEWASNRMKKVLSKDRAAEPIARLIQNILPGLPGGQALAQIPAYNDIPVVGALAGGAVTPVASQAALIKRAVDLARETGDWRAILAVANYPGLGREWLKVVKYEDEKRRARKAGTDSAKLGLGQMPQNSGWPVKIDQVIDGKISVDDALRYVFGSGGPSLPIEKRANTYRKAAEAAKAKREKAKR